jgi:preprotein translocase subunit YajC
MGMRQPVRFFFLFSSQFKEKNKENYVMSKVANGDERTTRGISGRFL